jgi:low temperature requirement protein LtrA
MIRLYSPLRARDPEEQHRASTALELFYDLVSVIAIAAVTAGLHHAISGGHGVEALPRFIFLFLAIWWAWMNFTWFASAFYNDGPVYRILVIVVMTGALIFAGGASYIFTTMDFSWGLLGWIIMRFGMASLWLRAAGDLRFRRTALRYCCGIIVAQIAWTVLYFSTEPGSGIFYAGGLLCFLIEWLVPMFAERAGMTPWHRHHIVERYGLLTIIVMGEILLSVSHGFGYLFRDDFSAGIMVSALSAIVIVFSLWWLYFDDTEHLPKASYKRAFLWGYGHVFFFGAISMLGAGIAAQLDLAEHHLVVHTGDVAWFIGGPLAIAFLALWAIRDQFHPLGISSCSLPIMAIVYGAAAALGSPVWVFAMISVIALVWRVPRWRKNRFDPPSGRQ